MNQINYLKQLKILLILVVLLFIQSIFIYSNNTNALIEDQLKKIEWFKVNSKYGSSSIRITDLDNKVIYIDPIEITDENAKIKADYIFITHGHKDHFDINSIIKLRKKHTKIISIPEIIKMFSGEKFKKMFDSTSMSTNDKKKIEGLEVETIPAYNDSHPKTKENVGFVITLKNGIRIYVSGSTGFITEMNNLKNIDIAILCVKTTYTLDGINAVKAINTIKPKVVIPVHWVDNEQKEIDYIQKNIDDNTNLVILNQK